MLNKSKKIYLSLILIILFSFVGCNSNQADSNLPVTEKNENYNEVVNEENESNEIVEEEKEVVEKEIEYGDFSGYFWEIKHEDAIVYLFGSVHVADSSIYPFTENVENAYETSDALVVEADVTNLGEVFKLTSLMRYENKDESFYDHVSEDGIKKIEKSFEELGLSLELFKSLKPWALGSTITQLQIESSGKTGEEGIDMYFLNKAKDNKEILELESIAFQFHMFNDLSYEEQESALISGIGTIEEAVISFDELYNNFLTGDDELMTTYLLESEDDLIANEKLNDIFLKNRNIGMAEKINEYLQTDKTYFVVAGLAHYLGDESVQRYLEEMGYTITRK